MRSLREEEENSFLMRERVGELEEREETFKSRERDFENAM